MIRNKLVKSTLSVTEVDIVPNVKVFGKSKSIYDLVDIPLESDYGLELENLLSKTKLIIFFFDEPEKSIEALIKCLSSEKFHANTTLIILFEKEDSKVLDQITKMGLSEVFPIIKEKLNVEQKTALSKIKLIKSTSGEEYNTLKEEVIKVLN